MKNLRSTLVWGLLSAPWAIATVALTAISILVTVPFIGARRAFFGVGKWWARQQLWFCNASWHSSGWEKLPEEIKNGTQSTIFMSNHESFLDPPLLMGAIPVPAVYIAKKEIKRMPLIGWAVWAAGVIFIDRNNTESALLSIERAAEQIRQGKNVVIFPEGTRTKNGQIGKFKKGGFSLAIKAGVPIIPLATVGGWDVFPKGALRFKPGKIHVIFGDAVYPRDYQTREALMAEVERQIREIANSVRCTAKSGNFV
ncbi:MAG: 1-acyl-sn-glycerol-3-phosphate acyltransferase [Holophagales bacterium]|nr:1-acyl-sn-glycerol-3-phosphate acyltransferase [Holophagales bacterium]